MPNELTLENFIRDMPEFKPMAYYDKHLDAIRIQILDCSIWEDRLDPIMTVYHRNHHPRPDGVNDIVGFVIKGVRHLLNTLGNKDSSGPIVIAEFLDEIVREYPTKSTKLVVEFWRSLGEGIPSSIEIRDAA
jgi:hypothetical protein